MTPQNLPLWFAAIITGGLVGQWFRPLLRALMQPRSGEHRALGFCRIIFSALLFGAIVGAIGSGLLLILSLVV